MDECFTEMEHHLAAEQEKVKDTGLPKQSNLEYGGLGRQVKWGKMSCEGLTNIKIHKNER